MSGPFATAEEFCEYIGIAIPADLGRLQALLDYSSALIRRHAGQTLSQASDSITIQPQYNLTSGLSNPLPAAFGNMIFLPEHPVTAITSLTSNSVPFTAYIFTSEGIVTRNDGQPWLYPVTITYTHGYPETADEFIEIKTICMMATARAYTLNERSASEFMGSTLAESAGYAPEIFLTEGEKMRLQFGKAVVG